MQTHFERELGQLKDKLLTMSSHATSSVANAVKAEVAQRLTAAGEPPLVLTSSHFVGEERSRELFEKTYDDYRRRIGVLYR